MSKNTKILIIVLSVIILIVSIVIIVKKTKKPSKQTTQKPMSEMTVGNLVGSGESESVFTVPREINVTEEIKMSVVK